MIFEVIEIFFFIRRCVTNVQQLYYTRIYDYATIGVCKKKMCRPVGDSPPPPPPRTRVYNIILRAILQLIPEIRSNGFRLV